MKFNIEIYVNGSLKTVIPNLNKKKIEQYKKTLFVQNGFYKVVKIV